MGRSLHDGGDGGGGYPWAKGLWYGVYPGDAPNGFANRKWRLALSIWVLGNAINRAAVDAGYPNWCLGTRGDTRHLEEAEKSEHNACVVSKLRSKLPADIPDEYRNAFLVLAIDVIEEVVDLLDLDAAFAYAYRLRDPKVYPKGYNHHNNMITLWGGSGEMRPLSGDVGHGHYSHNQNAYPGGRDGYLDALDSMVSWYGKGGLNTASSEEDELSALSEQIARIDQKVGLMKDRMWATLPGSNGRPSYFKVTNGVFSWSKKGEPGAQFNRVLDSGDGNTLMSALKLLAGTDAKLIAQLTDIQKTLNDVPDGLNEDDPGPAVPDSSK